MIKLTAAILGFSLYSVFKYIHMTLKSPQYRTSTVGTKISTIPTLSKKRGKKDMDLDPLLEELDPLLASQMGHAEPHGWF